MSEVAHQTAMLMSPSKVETAFHGSHCPGDMAVHMPGVLARPWVGVCVPFAFSLAHQTSAFLSINVA